MRFGKRKIMAAAAAGVAVTAAAVAAWFDELGLLLLLVIIIQVCGFAAIGQLVMSTRRLTDQRLRDIESAASAEIRAAINDQTFLEDLRSAALPQQHADQLLRTIEARHAHLEAALQQLADRIDPHADDPEHA